MKKKSGLGQKGVEVLLGATKSNQSSLEVSDVNEINTSSIKISPYQPRASFDSKTIDSLAESIKSQGVIQPLLVRKISEKNYELIAGERRLRAAKKIGLKKLPAYVKDVSKRFTKYGTEIPPYAWRVDPRYMNEHMANTEGKVFSSFEVPVLTRKGGTLTTEMKPIKKWTGTLGILKEAFRIVNLQQEARLSDLDIQMDKKYKLGICVW